MIMIQKDLVDHNLYETIVKCKLQRKSQNMIEIQVTYANGKRERIWTFDSGRNTFDPQEFIGKTKIEAVFYCDRSRPRKI